MVMAGGGLVFKTTRRSEAALSWLLPVHEAARGAGFRVPEIHRAASGRFLENGWYCETLELGRKAEPGQLIDLEPMVAAFHRATGSIPQRPGFCHSDEMSSVRDSGDATLSGMPQDLSDEVRKALCALSGKTISGVHGDLSVGNLLIAPGGPVLLDWDEARRDFSALDHVQLGRGTPAERRAADALEIASCWAVEPERAADLANAFLRSSE